MITKPTVLILGAGASKEAGEYPTGQELRHDVYNCLEAASNDQFKRLTALDHTPEEIARFREQLRDSSCSSVDAFLETRSDLVDIGKAAIAIELLRREARSVHPEGKLFHTAPEKYHWYGYLLDRLDTGGFDNFHENKLAIVTFNYDRSLEHFLYTSIMNRHNKYEMAEECGKMVGRIPIVHVYGSLGKLPWQSKCERGNEDDGIEYGAEPTSDNLSQCRDSMKIIGEIDKLAEKDPSFVEAREHIRKSERVRFVGFGFHETNTSRLQLRTLLEKKDDVDGTSLGMSDHERLEIDHRLYPGNNYILWDKRKEDQLRGEKRKGDLTCREWFRCRGGLS